jgi:hypothetical protein
MPHGMASFRFLALSPEKADELVEQIPSAKIDNHYKNDCLVGSIELIDTAVIVAIEEFKRANKIRVRDCDIFVSIASKKRSETWRTPKLVNYAVNIINCPIVFSYTC